LNFLVFLNAMAVTLDKLGDLYEYLWRYTITSVEANKANRTIRALYSMISEPVHILADTLQAIGCL
jgi:hypothetical protein